MVAVHCEGFIGEGRACCYRSPHHRGLHFEGERHGIVIMYTK